MNRWQEEERDNKPVRTGTLPPLSSEINNNNVWRCTGGMT